MKFFSQAATGVLLLITFQAISHSGATPGWPTWLGGSGSSDGPAMQSQNGNANRNHVKNKIDLTQEGLDPTTTMTSLMLGSMAGNGRDLDSIEADNARDQLQVIIKEVMDDDSTPPGMYKNVENLKAVIDDPSSEMSVKLSDMSPIKTNSM